MAHDTIDLTEEDLDQPVRIPVDAYVSRDYARLERDRLWRRVWLQAGRVEEIPEPGDYITFEIMDDSVIVLRSADGGLRAFHNVCPHRGRRLVDTPPGQRNAKGRRKQFVCGYHGWTFGLDGENTRIPFEEDWQGALETGGCRGLKPVAVDSWGGWAWINLDPEAGALREYLEPAASLLEPFELDRMRVRWRKWGIFNCNWKVAMEAFAETYHVQTTHPEFNRFGTFRGWGRTRGLHSNLGYDAPKNMSENKAKLRIGETGDPRLMTAEMQDYIWQNANTNTTQTLVDAAHRLAEELPEGTPSDQVLKHWLKIAREADEARGVTWPTIDAETVGESGTAWQVFPNFQIGHGLNNMLCYSARPYGDDPGRCVFEGAVYELFPEGEEPATEWEFCEPTAEAWCHVLSQDFSNMEAVQKGMNSMAFGGAQPNPYMERSIANLHRNLARYMGLGEPRPLSREG